MDNKQETTNKKLNLEEAKKHIENILKIQQYNMLERAKVSIQSIIDGNLKNNQITEEEYDILNEFLEEKILEMQNEKIEKIEEIEEKQKNEENEKKEEIKYIPIYHGKFNELPPKNASENAQKNIKDREEER